ncbi:hypothetical protein CWE13_05745 [Aliidiomarina shirensis]|uniref:Ribosomal RNA small subunit methyltransferase C n=1 Tax=Aliidiomarina shirensis TaxID=1048642 RepID=A0A432WUL6_9GAMM|nr:class I SAM-dependent methyltransferase [Aliidiomarina shirensis]RUO37460.1 hypothetical protein CWE13_05745 [Aliidiomarina shirensis]
MSVAASKLLVRQASLIQTQLEDPHNERVLLVNPSVGMAQELEHAGFSCISWILNAQALTGGAPETEIFQAHLGEAQHVAGIILNIPKEKQLTRMLLANLRAVAPTGTPIWLVGHNETGIRSYLKQEHAGWQSFQKLASGNHCQLLSSCLQSQAPFSAEDFISEYEFLLPSATGEKKLSITNLPGVFSSGHIDMGTQLLLEHLPANITGKVLDFGCGAGVISAWLATEYPKIQLSAVDINVLALEATQATLAKLGISADVFASDGLAKVAGKYEWIISNPPFHSGKQTDYQITQNFIRESCAKLQANGSLLIVANTFLPYREALSANFKHVNVLVQTPKFTVWLATNRKV